MPDQQKGEDYERRVAMILSMPNFFVIEAAIVLRRCMPQGVMMRMIGLNQDASGQVPTARASGDLGDQLKGTLGRAKIRQSQACIDRDHAHKRDIRKVMSLCQHLSSD